MYWLFVQQKKTEGEHKQTTSSFYAFLIPLSSELLGKAQPVGRAAFFYYFYLKLDAFYIHKLYSSTHQGFESTMAVASQYYVGGGQSYFAGGKKLPVI